MVFQSNKKAHDYSELVNEHYFYTLVFIQFYKGCKISLLQILSYFPASSLKMKGNHYFLAETWIHPVYLGNPNLSNRLVYLHIDLVEKQY